MTASASDPEGAAVSYAWDLDNDGNFDNFAGPDLSVTAVDLIALGLPSNGSAITIAVQAVDETGNAASAMTDIAITNLGPTLSIDSAPGEVLVGSG